MQGVRACVSTHAQRFMTGLVWPDLARSHLAASVILAERGCWKLTFYGVQVLLNKRLAFKNSFLSPSFLCQFSLARLEANYDLWSEWNGPAQGMSRRARVSE